MSDFCNHPSSLNPPATREQSAFETKKRQRNEGNFMWESLENYFNSGNFIPHGHCYLWKPELVWLNIVSDCAIALAYYSIPIVLVCFIRKRQDLPFHRIFLLFGAFIISCGTSHIMQVWTIWHPDYWLSGLVKSITALISLYTAVELVPLIPKALALPSPAQLELANQALKDEIIERKRAEAELQKAKDVAEAASRAKSQFLANTSHELRTPLNGIIGFSQILIEEAKELSYTDFIPDLEAIHCSGKHLLALIDDILDISKIEAGQMKLYLETFDIPTLINEVVTTTHPLVEKNGNTLLIDCASDLGTMHADPTKVRQVLLNLLSNAAKFTKQGSITLEVSREEKSKVTSLDEELDFSSIVFRVTDTGIGMTPEQLKEIFKAFTQGDASTTRKYGGTGLGLTISRHFCQMMSGDIAAFSQPNRGSTFTVRIPGQVVSSKTKSTLTVEEATSEALLQPKVNAIAFPQFPSFQWQKRRCPKPTASQTTN